MNNSNLATLQGKGFGTCRPAVASLSVIAVFEDLHIFTDDLICVQRATWHRVLRVLPFCTPLKRYKCEQLQFFHFLIPTVHFSHHFIPPPTHLQFLFFHLLLFGFGTATPPARTFTHWMHFSIGRG
ncbi:uncharacterized [Tachysurus ichikawai]